MRQKIVAPPRITPPVAIAAFIDAVRPQVAAIVGTVIAKGELATTVARLAATAAAVHEQFAILEAERKLTDEVHGELLQSVQALSDSEQHLPDKKIDDARLPLNDLLAQRSALLENLTIYLSDLRQREVMLTHGIEHGSLAMTEAFVKAAARALPDEMMGAGKKFIIAYLVIAHLRDRLQAPGFLAIGENTLTTLYVTGLYHSAKRRIQHALMDPMANALAMEMSFKSAKEVHQALQIFHHSITQIMTSEHLSSAQLVAPLQTGEVVDEESTESVPLEQQFAEIIRKACYTADSRR